MSGYAVLMFIIQAIIVICSYMLSRISVPLLFHYTAYIMYLSYKPLAHYCTLAHADSNNQKPQKKKKTFKLIFP